MSKTENDKTEDALIAMAFAKGAFNPFGDALALPEPDRCDENFVARLARMPGGLVNTTAFTYPKLPSYSNLIASCVEPGEEKRPQITPKHITDMFVAKLKTVAARMERSLSREPS